MAEPFDQDDYWIRRHRTLRGDPRSVGNVARTVEQNRAGDDALRRRIALALHELGLGGSVLDLGCGIGRAAPSFCDAGYAYLGLDVSPEAIVDARAHEPRGRYMVGSALHVVWGGPFDVIAALYVLVHFVDDRDWRTLLARIAASLRPGGALLIADQFPPHASALARHARHRSLAQYATEFAQLGLRFDAGFNARLASALRGPVDLHLARKLD